MIYDFEIYTIDDLINELGARDQKKAISYIEYFREEYRDYLASPETIGDLLRLLEMFKDTNSSDTITCLRFLAVLKFQGSFDLFIDLANNEENSLNVEIELLGITVIPDNKKILEDRIINILEILKKWDVSSIYYQGILLLYRIINEYPDMELSTPPGYITLNIEDMGKIDLLVKNNYEFYDMGMIHKTKNNLIDPSEFYEFCSQFITMVDENS